MIFINNDESFLKNPSLLLEIFYVMQNKNLQEIEPRTLRLINDSLYLIDSKFRNSKTNQIAFMNILKNDFNVTKILRKMSESGVLGSYWPAFKKSIGQMQFDLFHIYTVDEHTLSVLSNLRFMGTNECNKKYKFIKGFDDGILDFYSIKDGDVSNSTLKIYDFKLKELPTLTKLLTLASLQGIADLLTGEGIRFSNFEMDYETLGNTTNIKEIYAIGPAISLMMEGYIVKDELTSLRGTLVPATTINKTISKIPMLGDILVGKKIGEGVFGVSFKIKGPPKKLKSTVNPIKTLTPRFITRTLEKISN